MSMRAQRLLELQQMDLEIDAKTEALAQVESQLGETRQLINARERVIEERVRRQQLEKDQRALECEAQDLLAKIEPLDEKLYSGRIKIAKELTALQHEVDGFKAKRQIAEDQQLEIMTGLEDSFQALKQMETDLALIEAAWREDQQKLMAEQAGLKADIATLDAKKQIWIGPIPQADMNLYAELRESKKGRVVARVERGTCQGCRISLPMTEIQRVRVSVAPARCSSCGRVLIAR
ncbi:MAG: hypothetical protein Q7O66_02345 [Dehalococcoidia bacterium]|nr:hypothetical protein [Dehalococcoidia bacterium]